MATPLNVFKSVSVPITEGPITGDSDVVYTTPNGITTIVLMAQVANVDSDQQVHEVTLKQASASAATPIHLVRGYRVQPRDGVSLTTGKLIVEENGVIRCSTLAGSANKLELTLSFLESLNG